MRPVVVDKTAHAKGMLFTFEKEERLVTILFTTHALDRMDKWDLNSEIVGEALLDPEEVLVGAGNFEDQILK